MPAQIEIDTGRRANVRRTSGSESEAPSAPLVEYSSAALDLLIYCTGPQLFFLLPSPVPLSRRAVYVTQRVFNMPSFDSPASAAPLAAVEACQRSLRHASSASSVCFDAANGRVWAYSAFSGECCHVT